MYYVDEALLYGSLVKNLLLYFNVLIVKINIWSESKLRFKAWQTTSVLAI